MLSFVHLGKNVSATELSWYEEPILDACCRNIASSDELWQRVVEMSVLLLTCTQQRNPRSSWYVLWRFHSVFMSSMRKRLNDDDDDDVA